jgi:hypothetical protein
MTAGVTIGALCVVDAAGMASLAAANQQIARMRHRLAAPGASCAACGVTCGRGTRWAVMVAVHIGVAAVCAACADAFPAADVLDRLGTGLAIATSRRIRLVDPVAVACGGRA